MKITDEMVERVISVINTLGNYGKPAMRRALEAALNPPPVLCKNCGKPKIEHTWACDALEAGGLACPDYVWEPAP